VGLAHGPSYGRGSLRLFVGQDVVQASRGTTEVLSQGIPKHPS
jgi:hypothetical protein